MTVPTATFTRQHYTAIGYVLRDLIFLSPGEKKSVVMHFNHYFRATQDGYNAQKFIEGCYANQADAPDTSTEREQP